MADENAVAATETAEETSQVDCEKMDEVPTPSKEKESTRSGDEKAVPELSTAEVQAIIDRYKLKAQPSPENSELLGLVKRMDDKQKKMNAELSDLRFEKQYSTFLEAEMADKEFVTDGGKGALEKYLSRADRSDPNLWEDAKDFLSKITQPKGSSSSDSAEKQHPAQPQIDLSKFGKAPQPNATSLDLNLFKMNPKQFKTEITRQYKKK